MSAAWLGAQGAISREVIWLFAIALPVLLAGTWLGLKLYGRLDEGQFRKVVLILLSASGVRCRFWAVNKPTSAIDHRLANMPSDFPCRTISWQ
jgi:uncharacterized membrane protein YfcA